MQLTNVLYVVTMGIIIYVDEPVHWTQAEIRPSGPHPESTVRSSGPPSGRAFLIYGGWLVASERYYQGRKAE